jgi:hypothetical protein
MDPRNQMIMMTVYKSKNIGFLADLSSFEFYLRSQKSFARRILGLQIRPLLLRHSVLSIFLRCLL